MQKLKSAKTARPPGAPAQPDRRVRRTREALREALLALLPELGWDAIDVATLCARADIGRSTFYLHYADKTALLRGAFEDLQAHVSTPEACARTGFDYPFLPALLAHVYEQREVFRALLGRRSGQVVQDHFRDLLLTLFSIPPAGGSAQPGAVPDPRGHLLAGSLFQLMVWWLGSAQPVAPGRVEALFRAFSVAPPSAVA